MSTLERAIAIAAEAHAGQVDKAGAPYILHPLRVMLLLNTIEERIAGVLHDLVEDCPDWTFDRLRHEGFSEPVIAALEAVTKREGEHGDANYMTFVQRAGSDKIGRLVKLADLQVQSLLLPQGDPQAVKLCFLRDLSVLVFSS